MDAKRVKEICKDFAQHLHIVVINGHLFDSETKTEISDFDAKQRLIEFFDEIDAHNVNRVLDTFKSLSCENEKHYTIASLNGLELIDPKDYDLATVLQLQDTFGTQLADLLKGTKELYDGKVPKQALNIYGPSNFGKSYFIDNTFGKIFATCIGDGSTEGTIQDATDETELVMFQDKDRGCIPAHKGLGLKNTLQGRKCKHQVNPKGGAKYTIFAALTCLIQTQLPARLHVPNDIYDPKLKREFDEDLKAFENRMLFVEFKIDNHEFPWDGNTVYSIFVRGECR